MKRRWISRDIGADLTPYPFLHIFPQDQHEQLLIGGWTLWASPSSDRTELLGFTDDGGRITARLRGPETGRRRAGALSRRLRRRPLQSPRDTSGTGFPGGTYSSSSMSPMSRPPGRPIDGELHVDLDQADFLAVFPLRAKAAARLIGTVRDERADHPETLKFEDVSDRAIQNLKVEVEQGELVLHLPGASPRDRTFPQGPRLPAGRRRPYPQPGRRPGHEHRHRRRHQPGLEAEIGAGRPGARRLLDTYEPERIAFAQQLVATTDRAFTSPPPKARWPISSAPKSLPWRCRRRRISMPSANSCSAPSPRP